jgi:hypothetical protein
MKKLSFLGILILYSIITRAQFWSDPVIISKDGNNKSPAMTVDKMGVISCVWTHFIDYYDSNIYFARSVTRGDSWYFWGNISYNDFLSFDVPEIAVDTANVPYISYDYDVFSWPASQDYYQKFTGSGWTEGKSVAAGIPGAYNNNLVIDNNNRIYFFWYYGTLYYRTLDNNGWSEISTPYPGQNNMYSLNRVLADESNRIHCIGLQTDSGNNSRIVYYTFENGIWNDPLEICDAIYDGYYWSCDMSISSEGTTGFVWTRAQESQNPYYGKLYYSELKNRSLTQPFLLSENSQEPAIVFDSHNHPHIIDNEKQDSVNQLVHYYKNGNEWQREVLEENENGYSDMRLLSHESTLYLVYARYDTNYNSSILFRRLDQAIGIRNLDETLKVKTFPNPFSESIHLQIETPHGVKPRVEILDSYGRLVWGPIKETNSTGFVNLSWTGRDNSGNQVSSGTYFVEVTSGKSKILRKVTLVRNME